MKDDEVSFGTLCVCFMVGVHHSVLSAARSQPTLMKPALTLSAHHPALHRYVCRTLRCRLQHGFLTLLILPPFTLLKLIESPEDLWIE